MSKAGNLNQCKKGMGLKWRGMAWCQHWHDYVKVGGATVNVLRDCSDSCTDAAALLQDFNLLTTIMLSFFVILVVKNIGKCFIFYKKVNTGDLYWDLY